ncbi:MAG: hypothetical protein M1320_01435 [Patescibacteria group bacterium]|nr:hypothetical protein [Patescibacteria group bacterium]
MSNRQNKEEKKDGQKPSSTPVFIGFAFLFLVIVYKLFGGFILSLGTWFLGLIVLIGLIFVIFPMSPYWVEEYHAAAVYSFGRLVSEKDHVPPGLHFKRLWHKVRYTDTKASEIKLVETPEIQLPGGQATLKYSFGYSRRVVNAYKFLSVKDADERFEKSAIQALEQFTGDPNNPPKDWDEAMGISPEKYVAKSLYFFEGKDFPRYNFSEATGLGDPNLEKSYKKEKDLDPTELAQKKDNMEHASQIIRGTEEYVIPLQGIGMEIVQFNINKPIPGAKLKESLDDRNKIEQQRKQEEEKIELEKKQQEKYKIEFQNIVERIKSLTDLKLSPREATLRVMEMDEDLSKRLKSVDENLNTIILDGNLGEVLAGLAVALQTVLGGKIDLLSILKKGGAS